MLAENILEAMGSTPLVRLRHMTGPDDAQIYVKFEAVNVGGSIKTRTAYGMITAAEKDGFLHPDSIIVESTSGNQGIGLALVSAVKGYRCVIIMPDSVSEERRKIMQQYGAEVRLIHDEGDIGKCIADCTEAALDMKANDPRVFVPQQFDNPANPAAQRESVAREILEDIPCRIDGFCSGFGTGGTLTGIGGVLKAVNPETEIWALEPEHAAILSGGAITSHWQTGIGDGIIPKNLDRDLIDRVEIITDEEALRTAKRLAAEEGLLCGISSGSNVCGAMRLAAKLGSGKTVVTVLPDTGERYFSTPLFDTNPSVH